MASTTKTFAIVAKHLGNPYFDMVRTGCETQAQKLGVVCRFVGPAEPIPEDQATVVQELISSGIDGIALSVLDEKIAETMIREADSAGIPVVTFDSDAPNSLRKAYIGTDNYELGKNLGKILNQLNPDGGHYGVLSDKTPNIKKREEGLRSYLQDSPWIEFLNSPTYTFDSIDIALEQVADYTRQPNLTAVVALGGWPMFDSTRWKLAVDASRNITFVSADALPMQVELLTNGYVDGLVGQMPYQMGAGSIKMLHDITTRSSGVTETNIRTPLMEMVRVPLDLPELEVDMNYIANFKYVGFSLFGIIALTSVWFALWTWSKKNVRVVKASQPIFLIMVSIGALIMGASIIPLSMDDSVPSHTGDRCKIICMSVPWFASIGFTVIFSALFSKTWRINKIFHNKSNFSRMRVSEHDVMVPFVFLLVANVVVLICWTIIAPLEYVRRAHRGTDGWNRVISTYGACSNANALPFAIVMGVINLSALVIANWQAYEARTIQSEFAESRYIAIVMASLLQACLSGIPLLFVVREQPQAFYLVLVILIFISCMAILLLIFVPKMRYERKFRGMNARQRRQSLLTAITGRRRSRLGFGNSSASLGTNTSALSRVLTTFSIGWLLGCRQEALPFEDDYSISSSERSGSSESGSKSGSGSYYSEGSYEEDYTEDDGAEGLRLEKAMLISWGGTDAYDSQAGTSQYEAENNSVESVEMGAKAVEVISQNGDTAEESDASSKVDSSSPDMAEQHPEEVHSGNHD